MELVGRIRSSKASAETPEPGRWRHTRIKGRQFPLHPELMTVGKAILSVITGSTYEIRDQPSLTSMTRLSLSVIFNRTKLASKLELVSTGPALAGAFPSFPGKLRAAGVLMNPVICEKRRLVSPEA